MKPAVMERAKYGSLGGEEIRMSFDKKSIGHIMGVLTDLYSDPALAVLREYSTNAYDAHVEAGVEEPIEVTLPHNFAPQLVIRDYGNGMSRDEIASVYSKYGASTKRETDAQSGMLGLGCKSGLTYATQFNVVSVKGGFKTNVNVFRSEDGSGVMELVSHGPTTDHSGVTVTIPAKPGDFDKDFFAYWKPGTVLVDGEEPTQHEAVTITDRIRLVAGTGPDIIVMGNVPYKIDEEHRVSRATSSWYGTASHLVIDVPIGTVLFAPSREKLRYEHNTLKALSELRDEYESSVMDAVQGYIDKCKTKQDAVRTFARFRTLLFGQECYKEPVLEWQGKNLSAIENVPRINWGRTLTEGSDGKFRIGYRGTVTLENLFATVFIVGVPSDDYISSLNRKKIKELTSDISFSGIHIVADESTIHEWADPEMVFTYDEVKAVKLARTRRAPRQEGYKVHGRGHVAELDTSMPIYFVSPVDGVFTAGVKDTDQVVVIGRGSHAKFQRDYPTALPLSRAYEINKQKFLDNVPRDVLDSLMLIDRHRLQRADESKIEDPVLAEEVRLAKIDCSAWERDFNLWFSPKNRSQLRKYPLLFSLDHKHAYIYVNAVYNAKENNV